MSEFGSESYTPGEGATGAPEQLSEEARQRFAAAGAAMAAAKKEEKKSKKRDTRVAKAIIQFLNDDRYTHLFVLISRLVARDCPSIFILALLSLIHEESETVVKEYLEEAGQVVPDEPMAEAAQIVPGSALDPAANKSLIDWISRLQIVLSLETDAVLSRIMLDEQNMDGTVLQLTTFVLQDFFHSIQGGERDVPFENLHVLTANILQSVFEPFLKHFDKRLLQASAAEQKCKQDEDDD